MADVLPLDEFGMQTCKDCGLLLPLSAFGRLAANRLGVRTHCKKCHTGRAQEWYAANLDKALDTRLRRTFGITLEQYNALLAEQGGMCAICGKPPTEANVNPARLRRGRQVTPRLVVDHDHKTGAVRGLLCFPCNTGIGMLGDDPDLVRFALKYLEERA